MIRTLLALGLVACRAAPSTIAPSNNTTPLDPLSVEVITTGVGETFEGVRQPLQRQAQANKLASAWLHDHGWHPVGNPFRPIEWESFDRCTIFGYRDDRIPCLVQVLASRPITRRVLRMAVAVATNGDHEFVTVIAVWTLQRRHHVVSTLRFCLQCTDDLFATAVEEGISCVLGSPTSQDFMLGAGDTRPRDEDWDDSRDEFRKCGDVGAFERKHENRVPKL